MNKCYLFCLAAMAALVSGCATSPNPTSGLEPVTTVYCDQYLVYPLCAKDVNSDGEVDLMYFRDTNEIFMLSPEYSEVAISGLQPHRCIQPMNKDIRRTSSELLYFDTGTGEFRKAQIKSRLMLLYTRELPTINRCMNKGHIANSSADDDFGDEDFEEL